MTSVIVAETAVEFAAAVVSVAELVAAELVAAELVAVEPEHAVVQPGTDAERRSGPCYIAASFEPEQACVACSEFAWDGVSHEVVLMS